MSYPLGHYFLRAPLPASVRLKSLNTTRIMPMRAKIFRAASTPKPRSELSAHARGYGRRWQKARLDFLDRNPLCIDCLAANPKRISEATDVDHVVPHQGNQSLFWDETNWQSLCHSCHSRKTARERSLLSLTEG